MMKIFIRVVLPLMLLTTAFVCRGESAMKSLLTNAEQRIDSLFFGQNLNTRLDMVDYFEAGSQTYSNDDILKSPLRISALDDRHVRFDTKSPVTIDIYISTPRNDSLLVTVLNIPIDNGDTMVFIDDITTGRTIQQIDVDYTDWLVKKLPDGQSITEIIAAVPFITASAAVNPESGDITLSNTAILIPGLDAAISSAFLPELRFKWNGKKYNLSK